jgi:hypothetical protein
MSLLGRDLCEVPALVRCVCRRAEAFAANVFARGTDNRANASALQRGFAVQRVCSNMARIVVRMLQFYLKLSEIKSLSQLAPLAC